MTLSHCLVFRKPFWKKKKEVRIKKNFFNGAWCSQIPNVASQKFSLKDDRCALVRMLPPFLNLSLSLSLPYHLFLFIRMLSTAFRVVFFVFFFSYHIYILSSRRLASKFRQKHKLLNFLDIITAAEHLSPKSDQPPTCPSFWLIFLPSLSPSARTQATSSHVVTLP